MNAADLDMLAQIMRNQAVIIGAIAAVGTGAPFDILTVISLKEVSDKAIKKADEYANLKETDIMAQTKAIRYEYLASELGRTVWKKGSAVISVRDPEHEAQLVKDYTANLQHNVGKLGLRNVEVVSDIGSGR